VNENSETCGQRGLGFALSFLEDIFTNSSRKKMKETTTKKIPGQKKREKSGTFISPPLLASQKKLSRPSRSI